jgi:hypothetical protein
MFRASLRFGYLVLGLLVAASTAHSATFDFIYADRIEVTTYPSNVGFTLAGTDFGLVVNKGITNIDGPEFFGTLFSASSSNPAVTMHPFINNPGPPIMPVLPNQAIGSVSPYNTILTTKLLPGETLHNTYDYQVISMQVDYPPHFSGSAAVDITMTMGGNLAHYTILLNFTAGSDFNLVLPSAARVSSVPLATAAKPTTWGALKALYH